MKSVIFTLIVLLGGWAESTPQGTGDCHVAYVPGGMDSYQVAMLSKNHLAAFATSNDGMQSHWTDRRAAAAEYAKIFTDLNSAIPDLSKSEIDWLGTERQAYDRKQMSPEREEAFLHSRVFRIWQLHWEIRNIRSIIQSIQEWQAVALVRQENFFWGSLLYEFSQEDEVRENLEMLLALGAIHKEDFPGRLGVKWLSGADEGRVQLRWNWWAQAIRMGFQFNLAHDLAFK